MNTGVVSSRYAKALLLRAQELGCSDKVCTQIKAMLADPEHIPSPLEPALEEFIAFLVKKGRKDCIKSVFLSYVDLYCAEAGVRYASLTTVVESPELEEKLHALLEKQTGCKVFMETSVDPELLGGFVLEVGGYMLDASVRRQIEMVRRQFIISNNRLV